MADGCDKHDDEGGRGILCAVCTCVLVFGFLLVLTVLLVYAVLHPHKPRFILQDVTVYGFNVSIPNILTSSFQVTISSYNPNRRIGIYYDHLDLYLTYQDQQITLPTSLPPSYQGHKETVVWSPFVGGTEVPVAPFNSVPLGQDAPIGNLSVVVKIVGRVRWKVGTFTSGKYRLFVKCPAYLATKGGQATGGAGILMQYVVKCRANL
ncbi:hypothetical protein MLD38_033128 [Melastoma candidum]|uniref:Uncharacterized protein n=1 Tax=Melastoma candidum TaxID=119954 RepID=A0ACB9M5T0_9MYRT|nr:hypothetical protein MLD38_033128 [Melastoma candidum]